MPLLAAVVVIFLLEAFEVDDISTISEEFLLVVILFLEDLKIEEKVDEKEGMVVDRGWLVGMEGWVVGWL